MDVCWMSNHWPGDALKPLASVHLAVRLRVRGRLKVNFPVVLLIGRQLLGGLLQRIRINMYMSSRRLADLQDVPVLDTQRVHERLSLFSIGVQDTLVSILSQVDRSEFLQTRKSTYCICEKQKSPLTGPGSFDITFLLLASLVMAIVEGSKSGLRTVWNRRSRFPLPMLSSISLCCQMESERPSKGANGLPL